MLRREEENYIFRPFFAITEKSAHLDICINTGEYYNYRDEEEENCATLLAWHKALGENTADGDEKAGQTWCTFKIPIVTN